MNFKTTIVFAALSLFATPANSTDELFRVSPYTLKHTNGQLLLNFQTNEDQSLIIEDNGVAKVASVYKKHEHYKITLSQAPCASVKEFKILDAKTSDVLYKNTQSPAPCQSLTGDNTFVFGFISDTQQYRERHEDIARTIAHHHAIEPMQFLINGGDVVQNGDTEQEWIDYVLGGKLYLMDIPQIAALGNHDYRGSNGALIPKFFQQFMRWEGADKFGNLFFNFPEVQLLILNSNFSKLNDLEERQTWAWIEEKFIEAKKLNKPIIVASHFPVYSSSLNRFTSLSVIKMRARLVPLVEKYNVKLVLSGHTHMYERSLKSATNYLVAGPAGGRPNSPSFKNEFMKFFDKDSLTFTKLKLVNRNLSVETYNQENRLIDSIAIAF